MRENIGVGRVGSIRDDRALWDAAKRSNVEEVIESLPERLEQMLGRRFEGGIDLSLSWFGVEWTLHA